MTMPLSLPRCRNCLSLSHVCSKEEVLTIFEQLRLLELRMCLDLVDGWYFPRRLDQHLQYLYGAVGYANSLDFFSLFVDPDDLFPCFDERRRVIIHRSIAILVERLKDISGGKGRGPVNEPYVEVV